jgi:hypothetical protein
MTISSISGSSTGTWKSLINAVITQINAAFASRPYVWADSTARLAQTGMTIGETGYQTDTQVTYRATSSTATVAWSSPWITYTPTLTNVAVGTGGSALSSFKYRYVGGNIQVKGSLVLGTSGASVGSNPKFTLPVNREALTHPYQMIPGGSLYDTSSVVQRVAGVAADNTSVDTVRFYFLTPTGGNYDWPTALLPWTWAAGDAFFVDFQYTPA